MDSGYLLKLEHEEFARRMADEHDHQNYRITMLEKATEQNNKLLVSVERLAVSMESMQREVHDQGNRLDELESHDGEMWRKTTGYIATAIISLVLGFVCSHFGF